jgi:rubredoxin
MNTDTRNQEETMDKWECPCGYVYDPEEGDLETNIHPGTAWEDLPEDWVCPKCGAEQEYFEKLD